MHVLILYGLNRLYLYVEMQICVQEQLMKKLMNLNESGEEYKGGFRERKGRGEM